MLTKYKENIFSYFNTSRKDDYLTDFTIKNNDDTYKVYLIIYYKI